MPQIPFNPIPQVDSTGAPGTFERIDTGPLERGAALKAQGTQRVAGQINDIADRLADAAVKLQSLKNEGMAKDSDRATLTKLDDLAYNPQNGYFTKLGRDAVDGYADAAQRANEIFDEARAALPNDDAKRMFDRSASRNLEYTLTAMSRHAAQQQKLWQVGAADGRIATYQSTAALAANDPQRFNQALATIRSEVIAKGELLGWSAEQVNAEATAQESKARVGRIERVMADDPLGASTMYREESPYIAPAAKPALEYRLKSAVLPVQARLAADTVMKGGSFDRLQAALDSGDSALLRGLDQELQSPGKAVDTRAMLGTWLDQGKAAAERLRPNDPVFADMVTNVIKGRVATIVQAEDAAQRQQQDVLKALVLKHRPASIDDLLRLPGARSAYASLDTSGQLGILGLVDRFASGDPVKSNPGVYLDTLKRIFADEDDPTKIRSVRELVPLVGKGLSVADLGRLEAQFDRAQRPEDNPFLKDVARVRQTMRRMLRSTPVGQVQPDVAEEAAYRASADLDAKIESYRKAGKDPRALITPGAADYVLDPAKLGTFMPGARQAVSAAAAKVRASEYQVGSTYDFRQGRFRYKGGDPQSAASWERAQ